MADWKSLGKLLGSFSLVHTMLYESLLKNILVEILSAIKLFT